MEELANLPPFALLGIAVGVVTIHLPLLLGSRMNVPLFYAALFFLMSPFTTSGELAQSLPLKVARYYVVGLMLLSSLAYNGLPRFGPLAWAFTIMSLLYIVAAVWSDEPLYGLALKTSGYGVSFFAAMLLGKSLKDFNALQTFGKYVLSSAMVLTCAFLPPAVEQLGSIGRFTPYGLNANMTGLVGATNVSFAFIVFFSVQSIAWRSLAAGVMVASLLFVIMSGSRAALGVALIPTFIALIPALGNRLLPIALGVILPVGGLVYYAMTSELVSTETFERGDDVLSGRAEIWQGAIDLFWESPVFGKGWAYVVYPSGARGMHNMHNAYLQYLAETGVFGALIFSFALGVLCWQSWTSIRATRKLKYLGDKMMVWFWIGMLMAVLAVAIGEASLITGTTVLTVLFGVGIGILDGLPRKIKARATATMPHQRRSHYERRLAFGFEFLWTTNARRDEKLLSYSRLARKVSGVGSPSI